MIEEDRYKKLYEDITKERGKPFNHWELTALLEAYGLRDIDAQNIYESENLFELAKKLESFIDNYSYEERELSVEEIIPIVPRVSKNYIKGLAFALPMLIQIVATIFIGYSLWSSTEIDMASATAIAIGSFTALVVTGGIAQIIGRQGLFYIKAKQYLLASKVIKRFYIFGLKIIILIAIFLSVINLLFEFVPFSLYILTLFFYILLSILYLNFSIYYALEDFFDIVMFTSIGVILVYLFYRIFEFELIHSQSLALSVLNITLFFFSLRKLKKLELRSSDIEDATLPKTVILFHTLLPFFLYGFLYFSFLVADRFIAWSADYENNPYLIWFQIDYELGLDWALISLIFMIGVTEVSISELLIRINRATKDYIYSETQSYNNMVKYYLNKFNIIFTIASLFVAFLAYYFIYYLAINFENENLKNMLIPPIPTLFFIATLAYLFLVKGLMNILLLFSFSREAIALKAIYYAVLCNILLGLIISRLISYEYAVVGLLCGSILFWYISRKAIKKMIDNLDYYYYSAYY